MLFITVTLFLLLSGIYLNRAYSHRFDFIADHLQLEPMDKNYFSIGSDDNNNQTLRYAALGDSLTAGVGADENQFTFPFILANYLADQTKSKIEVINIAQGGATSQNVLDNQITPTLDFNPDLITILIGINDMHDHVKIDDFKQNLSKIIDKLRQTKAEIIVINIPYLGSTQSTWPPFKSYFDWQTKRFNNAINEVASSKNIKLLDLYSENETYTSELNDFYSPDYFHPSSSGYIKWAKYIYDNLGN